MMKIVFAGTPEFAVPVLQALLDSAHEVVAVYTQPDRPAGRGRHTRRSPVKQLAMDRGILVQQPVTLRDATAQTELADLHADLMVVVAYGLILPTAVLAMPRLGCVNVHASLLPRWRGAAPIQRAILAGDTETGVSLMQVEAGLDSGPVLARRACTIGATETAGQLHDRLAQLGAQLLRDSLDAIEQDTLTARVQDEAQVTYAAKLEKGEALIDWSLSAEVLDRRVRAFNPWPIAETQYAGRQLRIWEASVASDSDPGQAPGSVIAAGKNGIDVACGSGVLRLRRVQLPGARPVTAADFVNAHPLAGVRFGSG
jgi:methionyl-tRNA formyltransferase